MFKNNKNLEVKVQLLESLGFVCNHEDSDVSLMTKNNGELRFDFSACEPTAESIIYHAVNLSFEIGQNHGVTKLQESMKSLLNIGE